MTARRRSIALAVTLPLFGSLVAACGSPTTEESAARSQPVANESMATIDEDPCATAWKTLATAAEAHFAKYGAQPADEQTLVELGFLRETYDQYDLAPDGSVVVAPGSECEQYEQAVSTTSEASEGPGAAQAAHDCLAGRKTLETAVEAYYAVAGGPPADERTLVDKGFLRWEFDEYDLAPDGSVIATPGGGCV